MRILLIDTVSAPGPLTYAAGESGALRTVQQSWSESGREAETIMKFLRGLRRAGNLASGTLNGIVCVTGPGRFTGARVGTVVTNALGFALNIPTYGLDRLEFFVRLLAYENGAAFPLSVAIESEWGDYCSAVFPDASMRHDILTVSDKSELKKETTVIDHALFVRLCETHGERFLSDFARAFGSPRAADEVPLVPWYVRPATITTRKKL